MTAFVPYLEEDSQDRDLLIALQVAGMAAHRCAELGMNGASDDEQLAFAAARGFVIYTANVRDFARLHKEYMAAGMTHMGIIFQPERRWSIGEQARRLIRLWTSLTSEEMVNRIESLGQWGEPRESAG